MMLLRGLATVTDFSEKHCVSTCRVKDTKKSLRLLNAKDVGNRSNRIISNYVSVLGLMDLEYGSSMLPRNVGNYLSVKMA